MAQEQDRIAHGASNPNVPPYPPGTSSEQIRRDIEHTRAEMDETVDALEERVRPRHLLDDLLEMFRGSSAQQATAGTGDKMKQVGWRVLDRLKSNPMPAALIGAGIAWLLFEDEGRRPQRGGVRDYRLTEPGMYSGSYVDARTGQPYGEAAPAGASPPTGAEQQPGMTEKIREKASSAAEYAKQTASSAGAKVSEWAGSTRESMGGTGQRMRDYASSASEQMQRGYESGRHYMERGIEEYPLAMGGAAMAVGMLVGLLIPTTRTEDRYMGGTADQIKDRAKEAGRSVASATAGAAREETGRQGTQPGQLGEKIRRVAEDVKGAAAESARREELDTESLKQKASDIGQRTKEAAKEESQRQSGQQG